MSSEADTREAENPGATASGQEPAAEPAPGLPSIIVDPALFGPESAVNAVVAAIAAQKAEGEPAASQLPHEPAASGSDSAPAPEPEPEVARAAEAGAETSNDHAFDAASAERFAAAYRPSWEPTAPIETVPTAPRTPLPAAASSHRPPVGAAVMSSATIDDTRPPVTAMRKRATILVGASVAGFLVLAFLAVSSSSHEPPAKQASSINAPASANPSNDTAANAAPAPAAVEPPSAAAAEPAAAEPAALAAAEPAPVAAEPPPSAAAPAAAPAVTAAAVHVTAEPATAALTIDGNTVSNPFDTELLLGSQHELRASAPGFVPEQRKVQVDAETKIALVLAREPAAEPKPARRRKAEPVTTAPSPKPARTRAAAVQPPAKQASARKRKAEPAPAPAARTATKAKPKQGAGFVADSPY